MAIYKLLEDKKELAEVVPTSFGEQGVLERADLQRLLRDKPEVLEEGLLIISEEFGSWRDSNRRIDLLGLDAQSRLVVVELKRGDKMLTLVASALAGGDCIDDADVLRTGGTAVWSRRRPPWAPSCTASGGATSVS